MARVLLGLDMFLMMWRDGFKLRDYRKAKTDISMLGDKIDIYIYIYITYYILPIIYYLSYIAY